LNPFRPTEIVARRPLPSNKQPIQKPARQEIILRLHIRTLLRKKYHEKMSLPGLGLVAPPVRYSNTILTGVFWKKTADSIQTATTAPITTAATTAIHELTPNSEWRFEVAINSRIDVKVRVLLGRTEVS